MTTIVMYYSTSKVCYCCTTELSFSCLYSLQPCCVTSYCHCSSDYSYVFYLYCMHDNRMLYNIRLSCTVLQNILLFFMNILYISDMLHYILLLLDLKVLLVFFCVFCVTFAYLKSCKPAGSPPGPPTVPFMGEFKYIS